MHDHLIGRILAEEEELIARHRAHIDRMVELMKVEMGHVNNVDRPGSTVESYVTGVSAILDQQMEEIRSLSGKLQVLLIPMHTRAMPLRWHIDRA